jgi:hypothetical protein
LDITLGPNQETLQPPRLLDFACLRQGFLQKKSKATIPDKSGTKKSQPWEVGWKGH